MFYQIGAPKDQCVTGADSPSSLATFACQQCPLWKPRAYRRGISGESFSAPGSCRLPQYEQGASSGAPSLLGEQPPRPASAWVSLARIVLSMLGSQPANLERL